MLQAMNSSNSPDPSVSAPSHGSWENLAASIFARCKNVSEDQDKKRRVAQFDFSDTVRGSVVEYDGILQKLEIVVSAEEGAKETFRIFFDEQGRTESLRTISEATKVFDNGIRRGSGRRSLHAVCSFRQDFSATGEPVELTLDQPGACAQLHIHTKAYVAMESVEAANSFLGYAFDDLGIVSAGVSTADMTYCGQKSRISISQNRLVADVVSEGPEATADGESTALAVANAVDGKICYEVSLYAERLAVRMAGLDVGAFQMRRRLQIEDLF